MIFQLILRTLYLNTNVPTANLENSCLTSCWVEEKIKKSMAILNIMSAPKC